MYDDTSPAFLMFWYDVTGVYFHRWNNLLPAASSYVINGEDWQLYDGGGEGALGFTYHGT